MTDYNGTDVFGPTTPVTSNRLNTTVLWHGTVLPTSTNNQVPANGKFLLVNSLTNPTTASLYIQTNSSITTPNFVKIPFAGITQSNRLVYPRETDIVNMNGHTLETIINNSPLQPDSFVINNPLIVLSNADNALDGDFDTATGKDSYGSIDVGEPTDKYVYYDLGGVVGVKTVHWKTGTHTNGNGNGLQVWAREEGTTWVKIHSSYEASGIFNGVRESTTTVNKNIDRVAYTRNTNNGYNKLTPYELEYTLQNPPAQTNPPIKHSELSASADQDLAEIRFNIAKATTTTTEIQIQISTDDSSWINVRTLKIADLDEGFNYIRFNRPIDTHRYLRIIGTDTGDGILSITDSADALYVLTPTTEQWNKHHSHLNIDTDDSSTSPII